MDKLNYAQGFFCAQCGAKCSTAKEAENCYDSHSLLDDILGDYSDESNKSDMEE